MKRPILRASFFSTNCKGSKFFTSAAIWQANREASKPLMRSTPLLPASNACQTSPELCPMPQISPTPVTTTRRAKLFSFRVGVDVIDRILHGTDLLRLLVRNLDVEGLFKGHYQFDGVERVSAQVVYKRRICGDFALIHTQLLNDNLFYALFYRCHVTAISFSRRSNSTTATSDAAFARTSRARYDFVLACASMYVIAS